ncbi:hypothetical protein CR513_16270, partial [Mucuna pruriens]
MTHSTNKGFQQDIGLAQQALMYFLDSKPCWASAGSEGDLYSLWSSWRKEARCLGVRLRSPSMQGSNQLSHPNEKYDYWKQRMIAFFDSCYIDVWDMVKNGNYIPIKKMEYRFQDHHGIKNKNKSTKKFIAVNFQKKCETHWLSSL